jgi:signal transduction histidine kinase
VLTLSHEQPNYFNEDHLRLLTASAGAVAIGIHNANLYTITVADMERSSELLRQKQTETSKSEAILQSLSDGVLVCDPDGSVLSVNPAVAAILERSIEKVLLSDLYHVLEWLPDNQIDKLLLNELLKRPADADGNARRFESTVQIGLKTVNLTLKSVFKDSGGMSDTEFIGALLVLRDKTREVESDRLKTEFIGTMSHELRTPMTSIKGYTQLLVMGSLGPVNDTQREFLDTIQTNAERMISIINEVLELTKIETGSIDLEKRAVHLPEVLGSVFAELRSLAAAREHELLPGSHLTSMPSVQADPTRLHQVLVNLVSNGIKYTPKGGSIVVDGYEAVLEELPQHVRDCLSADRRYTQIDVCDTGVGIAAHELDKVFERFYRTENPMKVEAGGTGLGLSLTRPLIELMGGRIWVTSTLGEGSTFSFILPTE